MSWGLHHFSTELWWHIFIWYCCSQSSFPVDDVQHFRSKCCCHQISINPIFFFEESFLAPDCLTNLSHIPYCGIYGSSWFSSNLPHNSISSSYSCVQNLHSDTWISLLFPTRASLFPVLIFCLPANTCLDCSSFLLVITNLISCHLWVSVSLSSSMWKLSLNFLLDVAPPLF